MKVVWPCRQCVKQRALNLSVSLALYVPNNKWSFCRVIIKTAPLTSRQIYREQQKKERNRHKSNIIYKTQKCKHKTSSIRKIFFQQGTERFGKMVCWSSRQVSDSFHLRAWKSSIMSVFCEFYFEIQIFHKNRHLV